MKPPAFEYVAPRQLTEAVALLSKHPDAKVLAGGQSLLPIMKLRLAKPSVLVDLGRIPDLAYIREADGWLSVGANARLYELETPFVKERCPLLHAALHHIAHPTIRHRSTACGSLAHADPAAELPVVAVALDAELRCHGPRGARTVKADDFFVSIFTTALEPDEILVEARFPVQAPGTGWAFQELSRRPGDFALVAVAALLERSGDGTITRARVALGGVGDRPLRARDGERALEGRAASPETFRAAAAAAMSGLRPPADVHGSSAYRRQIAEVLVERALAEAWTRAGAGRRA